MSRKDPSMKESAMSDPPQVLAATRSKRGLSRLHRLEQSSSEETSRVRLDKLRLDWLKLSARSLDGRNALTTLVDKGDTRDSSEM